MSDARDTIPLTFAEDILSAYNDQDRDRLHGLYHEFRQDSNDGSRHCADAAQTASCAIARRLSGHVNEAMHYEAILDRFFDEAGV